MFPLLSALVSGHPPDSFLVELLRAAGAGTLAPLLSDLEARLDLLNKAGKNLTSGDTVGLLRGPRAKFFSGAAEVFALSWFLSAGLLREVGVPLNPAEAVSGKLSSVEGSIAWRCGDRVLFDVKSLQAHVQQYVDDIIEHVGARVASMGHAGLALAPHISGASEVEYVRTNFAKIVAAAEAAIPTMLAGQTANIWSDPSFRLRAELRKGRVQTGFSSVAAQIFRRQDLIWPQCHQASTTRPFLLVLVRTPGMGIEVGDMGQLLVWALRGTKDAPGTSPIFGATSREIVPKTKRPKAFVHRCVSAVLLIDVSDVGKERTRLVVNRYARHPLPKRLRHALRR